MVARDFAIEYRVFSKKPIKAPKPETLKGIRQRVTWKTRAEEPTWFELPAYLLVDEAKRNPFSEAIPFARKSINGQFIEQLMGQCDACGTVTVEGRYKDLSPLQLALELVGTHFARKGAAVVIDMGSGIGYTADDISRIANELNAHGEHRVRESVVLLSEPAGKSSLRVRTRGLGKFGHRELLIERWPATDLEAASHYMFDNLAQYAALGAVLEAGQTMHYDRTDPSAKVFFSEGPDDALRVTDCHRIEKRALTGLTRLQEMFIPLICEALANARPKKRRSSKKAQESRP